MKNKYVRIALAAAMLIALALAAYFMAAPLLEKHNRAERQAALLESIATGDGMFSADQRSTAAPVDCKYRG